MPFLSRPSPATLRAEAVAKLARMQPGAANPFVMGSAATQRALTVMHECVRPTMAAWTA